MKLLQTIKPLGIGVIVVIVLVVWFTRDRADEKTNTSRLSSTQASLNPVAMMTAQEFPQREKAEKIINQTQGKEVSTDAYEMILTGVVPSPTAPALVYFATSSSNSQELFTGVYLYDTLVQRWQRIYKRTTAAEEGKAPRVLRVLAVQEKELILLSDLFGRKISRCESLWLQDSSSLLSLNSESPHDGFKPFVLPPALRDAEKARMNTCLARP